jgi:hypothetical protein
MPGSPRVPIEAHRKRLLQPLHDRWKLQPIGGLNIERQPFLLKPKSTDLKGKISPRLVKHPAEDRYCPLRFISTLVLIFLKLKHYKLLFIRILF